MSNLKLFSVGELAGAISIYFIFPFELVHPEACVLLIHSGGYVPELEHAWCNPSVCIHMVKPYNPERVMRPFNLFQLVDPRFEPSGTHK